MGLILNASPKLDVPLLFTDERIFLVPAKGQVDLLNFEFKILYFLRARGELHLDQQTPLILNDGDIVVIPKGCHQKYINPEEKSVAQIHAFRLVLENIKQQKQQKLTDRCRFILDRFARNLHFSARHVPDIIDSINVIRRELEKKATGWEWVIHAAAWQFLASVARTFEGKDLKSDQLVPSRALIVSKAREFIHKNYYNPITLGEIALYVGRGEEHLSREFKKSVGITVFQYLRKTRIDAAASLIVDSSYAFGQIAELTGFQSLAFFSHCFRKAKGKSPSEYRASLPHDLTTNNRISASMQGA